MRHQRGQSLVGSLVVIVIIMIAVVLLMRGTSDTAPKMKADGRGKTVLGNAMASANDSACLSNLGQVRQMIQVQKATDEEFRPLSITDIPGAGSVGKCPVGKETYTIAENGDVHCPHLGHEKY